jgi:hypothetical protein
VESDFSFFLETSAAAESEVPVSGFEIVVWIAVQQQEG